MNLNTWPSAPAWDTLLFEDMTGFCDNDTTPVYSMATGPITSVRGTRQNNSFPSVTPGTLGGGLTSGSGGSSSGSVLTGGSTPAPTSSGGGTITQATGGGRTNTRPGTLTTSGAVRTDILPRFEAAVQAIQTRAATPTAPPVTTATPAVMPIVEAPGLRMGGGGGGGGGGGPQEETQTKQEEAAAQQQPEKKGPSLIIVAAVGAGIIALIYYLNK